VTDGGKNKFQRKKKNIVERKTQFWSTEMFPSFRNVKIIVDVFLKCRVNLIQHCMKNKHNLTIKCKTK
jgi:hypothetical protein